jgi:hypothetical protein
MGNKEENKFKNQIEINQRELRKATAKNTKIQVCTAMFGIHKQSAT